MSRQRGRRGDTGNHTEAASTEEKSAIDGLVADLIARRMWSIVPFRRHSRHQSSQHGRSPSSGEGFHAAQEPPSPPMPSTEERLVLSPFATRPSTSSSTSTTLVSFGERHNQPYQERDVLPALPTESQSGIDWKFAYEGNLLLERSCREATSPQQHPGVTRRLYLDGIAYILRGYPPDLDEDELFRLQQAVSMQLDGYPASRVVRQQAAAECGTDCSHDETSTLAYETSRRATLLVGYVVKIVSPYARLALAQALYYERRYNISERIVTSGVNVGAGLWRWSFNFVQQAAEGILDGLGYDADSTCREKSRSQVEKRNF